MKILICFFVAVTILLSSQHLWSQIINVPADQPTVQAGIDIANEGDTILVHPGTYTENINYTGKTIVVGSLYITTGDTSYIETTVLDKSQMGPVVTFIDVQDHNAVLSGFTITNTGLYEGNMIACLRSSPTLNKLDVSGSIYSSTVSGGGLWCMNESSPRVENVDFHNNHANSGGGIYCYASSHPALENVIIRDNYALFGGGLYCNEYSCPTLINVKITGNEAENFGGGIDCYKGSDIVLKDVLISNNSADRGAGLYIGNNISTSFINLTVTENTANSHGGAFFYSDFDITIVNSIFWNNSPNEIHLHEEGFPSSFSSSFNDISGGEAGITTNSGFAGTIYWLDGNMNADPLFSDVFNGDFRLTENSPCIDAGNPDTTGLSMPALDIDGNPRIYNDVIDMGAYEHQGSVGITDNSCFSPDYELYQNQPNPCSHSTTIKYSLSQPAFINLTIYDLQGKRIETLVHEYKESGTHSLIWNTKNIKPGLYLYMLNSSGKSIGKKVVVR